jgi:hypothetical protein
MGVFNNFMATHGLTRPANNFASIGDPAPTTPTGVPKVPTAGAFVENPLDRTAAGSTAPAAAPAAPLVQNPAGSVTAPAAPVTAAPMKGMTLAPGAPGSVGGSPTGPYLPPIDYSDPRVPTTGGPDIFFPKPNPHGIPDKEYWDRSRATEAWALPKGQVVGYGGYLDHEIDGALEAEVGEAKTNWEEKRRMMRHRLGTGWADKAALRKEMNDSADGQEFNLMHDPLDDAGFSRRLFRATMGRDPTAAEIAEWTSRLEQGVSRDDLIDWVKGSEGFKGTGKTWESVLAEVQKARGQGDSWTEELKGDQLETDISNAFKAEMGRPPTKRELAKYANQVRNKGVKMDVVDTTTNDQVTRQFYQALMGAGYNPTADDLAMINNGLSNLNGLTEEQFLNQMASWRMLGADYQSRGRQVTPQQVYAAIQNLRSANKRSPLLDMLRARKAAGYASGGRVMGKSNVRSQGLYNEGGRVKSIKEIDGKKVPSKPDDPKVRSLQGGNMGIRGRKDEPGDEPVEYNRGGRVKKNVRARGLPPPRARYADGGEVADPLSFDEYLKVADRLSQMRGGGGDGGFTPEAKYDRAGWEGLTNEQRYMLMAEGGFDPKSDTGNRLRAGEDLQAAFREKYGNTPLNTGTQMNNTDLSSDLVWGYGDPKLFGQDAGMWAADPSRIMRMPDGRWVMEANNLKGDTLAKLQKFDDDSGMGDGTKRGWTAAAFLLGGAAAAGAFSGAGVAAAGGSELAAAGGQGFGTAAGTASNLGGVVGATEAAGVAGAAGSAGSSAAPPQGYMTGLEETAVGGSTTPPPGYMTGLEETAVGGGTPGGGPTFGTDAGPGWGVEGGSGPPGGAQVPGDLPVGSTPGPGSPALAETPSIQPGSSQWERAMRWIRANPERAARMGLGVGSLLGGGSGSGGAQTPRGNYTPGAGGTYAGSGRGGYSVGAGGTMPPRGRANGGRIGYAAGGIARSGGRNVFDTMIHEPAPGEIDPATGLPYGVTTAASSNPLGRDGRRSGPDIYKPHAPLGTGDPLPGTTKPGDTTPNPLGRGPTPVERFTDEGTNPLARGPSTGLPVGTDSNPIGRGDADPGVSANPPGRGPAPGSGAAPAPGSGAGGGYGGGTSSIGGGTSRLLSQSNAGGAMDPINQLLYIGNEQIEKRRQYDPIEAQIIEEARRAGDLASQEEQAALAGESIAGQFDRQRGIMRRMPGVDPGRAAALASEINIGEAGNKAMAMNEARRAERDSGFGKRMAAMGLGDTALKTGLGATSGAVSALLNDKGMEISRENALQAAAASSAASAARMHELELNRSLERERLAQQDSQFDETRGDRRYEYDTTFREGTRRYDQGYNRGVYTDDRNFGENRRRYDQGFDFDVYQYNNGQDVAGEARDAARDRQRWSDVGGGVRTGVDIWNLGREMGWWADGGRIPRPKREKTFNNGGEVKGTPHPNPNVDTVDAKLRPGEGVINVEGMQILDKVAPGFFEKINERGMEMRKMGMSRAAMKGLRP